MSHWNLVLMFALACSGSQSSASHAEPSHAEPNEPTEPTEPNQEVQTMRSAIEGSLSDEEVRFIHQALLRSGTEYTEEGLHTFIEWELVAVVQSTPERYELLVAGPRVNAEWELTIDRRTGDVTEGMVATLAEEPEPEQR